jgi:TonB family protein
MEPSSNSGDGCNAPSASRVEHLPGQPVGIVDSLPQLIGALAPVYPTLLRKAGAEGRVLFEFIVDTSGEVERPSIRAAESSNSAFFDAAGSALLASRFRPGWSGGRKASVIVRQAAVFRIH